MRTFRSPATLPSDFGFDANVSLFACVLLSGDALLHGEDTHSSIHDGSCVYCSMNRSVAPSPDTTNGPLSSTWHAHFVINEACNGAI
jgi:7-keto-8-aminopelargonate synthetase-like enzyme